MVGMIRGLIGKVFVLALGIFAAFSMAPEPERSKADDAPRKAALRRLLTDPRNDAGTGSTSPEHRQAGGEAGPTTESRILGRLTRGQNAELVRDMGNGWAEIRALDTGARGFMALRFLAPAGD